jgi:hypothetical protein
MPIIAIDRTWPADRFCSVISDDREASMALTRSLLQPMPRQIVLIGARPELSVSQERAAGFKQALEGFDGEVLIEHGTAFSRECGRRIIDENYWHVWGISLTRWSRRPTSCCKACLTPCSITRLTIPAYAPGHLW